eukprot:TRINITY_DN25528_c1_g1_i1.p1 TRINITY_DN25528_c1_g1~~TRINITY_DN25528_c1_g1_i1.p1  ORF type:complete len:123 (+),score=20.55 TRINITY_DN25528_c1_g1_i1:433-801(+)
MQRWDNLHTSQTFFLYCRVGVDPNSNPEHGLSRSHRRDTQTHAIERVSPLFRTCLNRDVWDENKRAGSPLLLLLQKERDTALLFNKREMAMVGLFVEDQALLLLLLLLQSEAGDGDEMLMAL